MIKKEVLTNCCLIFNSRCSFLLSLFYPCAFTIFSSMALPVISPKNTKTSRGRIITMLYFCFLLFLLVMDSWVVVFPDIIQSDIVQHLSWALQLPPGQGALTDTPPVKLMTFLYFEWLPSLSPAPIIPSSPRWASDDSTWRIHMSFQGKVRKGQRDMMYFHLTRLLREKKEKKRKEADCVPPPKDDRFYKTKSVIKLI